MHTQAHVIKKKFVRGSYKLKSLIFKRIRSHKLKRDRDHPTSKQQIDGKISPHIISSASPFMHQFNVLVTNDSEKVMTSKKRQTVPPNS